MERDTAAILDELGGRAEARTWSRAADERARRMRSLLWDEGRGLFLDYDFEHVTRRDYPFATAFFPLWVGGRGDAGRGAAHGRAAALALLLRPGGLMTSTAVTGQQWDAPFGWAPLELVAVAKPACAATAFDADADRVTLAFLGTVLAEFAARGADLREVRRRAARVARPHHGRPALRLPVERDRVRLDERRLPRARGRPRPRAADGHRACRRRRPLNHPSTLNQADEHEHDRRDEQDVDEATHRVRGPRGRAPTRRGGRERAYRAWEDPFAAQRFKGRAIANARLFRRARRRRIRPHAPPSRARDVGEGSVTP